MRRPSRIFRKILYLVFFTLLAYLFLVFFNIKTKINFLSTKKPLIEETKLKYILQWTSPSNTPFVYMGRGQKGFIHRNCSYTNCYVTADKKYLRDYTLFDVIAFAGPEIVVYNKYELPLRRSSHQKYVFANIESASHYPICRKLFNGYFNWTWTYKLDSDLRWGYLVVKNTDGNVIGPKKEMHWMKQEDMLPVSEDLKKVLKGKTKLVAWFVSNCATSSGREKYAHQLDEILKEKYNQSVDIYGVCGSLNCSRDKEWECFKMIRTDYYFYLSFENAFSEDYVTEKLLNAVQNNAIPVVYGGADYNRFLPTRSYLNARELTPERLASKMYELMNNFEQYVEYFRWTNHYSYHRQVDSTDTDEYCKMCELLNDEEKVRKVSVYKDFKKWWDPADALCYGYTYSYNLNIVI